MDQFRAVFRMVSGFSRAYSSTRPVLLLKDGHASHTTIEVIELARASNVHILCLPAHTTHVLQPLDVGGFKSFKSHFSKACSKYMSQHPGRVVTADKLALLSLRHGLTHSLASTL